MKRTIFALLAVAALSACQVREGRERVIVRYADGTEFVIPREIWDACPRSTFRGLNAASQRDAAVAILRLTEEVECLRENREEIHRLYRQYRTEIEAQRQRRSN